MRFPKKKQTKKLIFLKLLKIKKLLPRRNLLIAKNPRRN